MPRAETAARPAAAERARDRELLNKVSGGDIAALRALYDEHAGRALAVAYRILKDMGEAEDVVQETFLELWRRAAQYDQGRGGAVAWIVTIARSRAIDRLRATGSASRAIEASALAATPEAVALASDEAERNRDRARIAEALAALPAEQRRTIELAYFEGLSQTEISAVTRSPLGTVKMRVRLAISKLAALLRED